MVTYDVIWGLHRRVAVRWIWNLPNFCGGQLNDPRISPFSLSPLSLSPLTHFLAVMSEATNGVSPLVQADANADYFRRFDETLAAARAALENLDELRSSREPLQEPSPPGSGEGEHEVVILSKNEAERLVAATETLDEEAATWRREALRLKAEMASLRETTVPLSDWHDLILRVRHFDALLTEVNETTEPLANVQSNRIHQDRHEMNSLDNGADNLSGCGVSALTDESAATSSQPRAEDRGAVAIARHHHHHHALLASHVVTEAARVVRNCVSDLNLVRQSAVSEQRASQQRLDELEAEVNATRFENGVLAKQVTSLLLYIEQQRKHWLRATLIGVSEHDRFNNDDHEDEVGAIHQVATDAGSTTHLFTLPQRGPLLWGQLLSRCRGPPLDVAPQAILPSHLPDGEDEPPETQIVDLAALTFQGVQDLVTKNRQLVRLLWLRREARDHDDASLLRKRDRSSDTADERSPRRSAFPPRVRGEVDVAPIPMRLLTSSSSSSSPHSSGDHQKPTAAAEGLGESARPTTASKCVGTDPLLELFGKDLPPPFSSPRSPVDQQQEVGGLAIESGLSLLRELAETVSRAAPFAPPASPIPPSDIAAAIQATSKSQSVVKRCYSTMLDLAATVDAQWSAIQSLSSDNEWLHGQQASLLAVAAAIPGWVDELHEAVNGVHSRMSDAERTANSGREQLLELRVAVDRLAAQCVEVTMRENVLTQLTRAASRSPVEACPSAEAVAAATPVSSTLAALEQEVRRLAGALELERQRSVDLLETSWRLEEEALETRRRYREAITRDVIPRDEFTLVSTELVSVKGQVTELTSTLEASKLETVALTSTIAEMTAQLVEQEANYRRQLRMQDEATKQERDINRKLRADICVLEHQFREGERQALQSAEQLNATKDVCAARDASITSLESKIVELQATLIQSAFSAGVMLLPADISTLLLTRLQHVEQANHVLARDVERYASAYPAALSTLEQLQRAHAMLITQCQTHQATTENLLQLVADRDATIARLRTEHDAERRMLQALTQQSSVELTASRGREAQLREKLQRLSDDRVIATIKRLGITQSHDFAEAIANLEGERNQWREQFDATQKKLDDSRTDAAQVETRLVRLQQEWTELNQLHAATAAELSRAEALAVQLREDVRVARVEQSDLALKNETALASVKAVEVAKSRVDAALEHEVAENEKLLKDNTTLKHVMSQQQQQAAAAIENANRRAAQWRQRGEALVTTGSETTLSFRPTPEITGAAPVTRAGVIASRLKA